MDMSSALIAAKNTHVYMHADVYVVFTLAGSISALLFSPLPSPEYTLLPTTSAQHFQKRVKRKEQTSFVHPTSRVNFQMK